MSFAGSIKEKQLAPRSSKRHAPLTHPPTVPAPRGRNPRRKALRGHPRHLRMRADTLHLGPPATQLTLARWQPPQQFQCAKPHPPHVMLLIVLAVLLWLRLLLPSRGSNSFSRLGHSSPCQLPPPQIPLSSCRAVRESMRPHKLSKKSLGTKTRGRTTSLKQKSLMSYPLMPSAGASTRKSSSKPSDTRDLSSKLPRFTLNKAHCQGEGMAR